jgi:hypothetical protein
MRAGLLASAKHGLATCCRGWACYHRLEGKPWENGGGVLLEATAVLEDSLAQCVCA